MTISLDKILTVLKTKNYPIHEDDKKNYNLNLVGIRHNSTTPNAFDDLMCVFWKFNGNWTFRVFPCTTDPGSYWLQNPSNVEGTGILKEMYHKAAWKIGMHQGKYKALVQNAAVTCIRDFDKDNVLDFNAPDLSTLTKFNLNEGVVEWKDKTGKLIWREQTGMFGMNGHRANENGQSVVVDKWSAMCQVLQNRQVNNPENQLIKVFEFDYFLHLCEMQVAQAGRDVFDYSLINEKDFTV